MTPQQHRVAALVAALVGAGALTAFVGRLRTTELGHWIEVARADGEIIYVSGPFPRPIDAAEKGHEYIRCAELTRLARLEREAAGA